MGKKMLCLMSGIKFGVDMVHIHLILTLERPLPHSRLLHINSIFTVNHSRKGAAYVDIC